MNYKEKKELEMTAKELFDKHAVATLTGVNKKLMNLKMFTQALAEVISLPVELPVSQENGGHHNWVGSGELVRKDVSHDDTTFYINYLDEQIVVNVPHDFDDVTRVGEHIKVTLEFYIP